MKHRFKLGDKVRMIQEDYPEDDADPDSPGYCDDMLEHFGKVFVINQVHAEYSWYSLEGDPHDYWYAEDWLEPVFVGLNRRKK